MSLTSTGVRRLVLDRTVSLILIEAQKGDKAVPIATRAFVVGTTQMGALAEQAEAEVAEMLPKWWETVSKVMAREVAVDATDDEVADDIYAKITERRKALEASQPPPIRST